MRSLLDRLRGATPAPTTTSTAAPDVEPIVIMQETVTCGIYSRGPFLFICDPDDTAKAKVVKVVTLPLPVYRRYRAAHAEWSKVQADLDAYPQTLRLRKKAVRKPKGDVVLNLPQSPAENPV